MTKLSAKFSVDEKSYQLAQHFLGDEAHECCLQDFAQTIQDSVEIWMQEHACPKENAPYKGSCVEDARNSDGPSDADQAREMNAYYGASTPQTDEERYRAAAEEKHGLRSGR